jgi:serine/threonine protein kinase
VISGLGANLNPYFDALTKLRQIASTQADFISADRVSFAIKTFRDTFSTENIPKLSQAVVIKLDQIINKLKLSGSRRIPTFQYHAFLESLYKAGFIPAPREEKKDFEKRFTKLLNMGPEGVAQRMEEGARKVYLLGESLRGLSTSPFASSIPFESALEAAPSPDGEQPTVQAKMDYKLIKEIGGGRYSRVYRGKEVNTKRDVAIKIVTVPDEEKRNTLFQGFRREQELLADSTSDRIVRVYTTELPPEGNPFMAMEYLRDGSLTEYLKILESRRFDLNQRVSMAAQALAALAECHQKKIIHRDFKPDNLFCEGEKVKLGDFGLARKIDEKSRKKTKKTIGTIGYIPPENLPTEERESLPHNFQSDIYAAGITLYQIFTGKFPIPGENALEVMRNTVEVTPPPPSQVRPEMAIPSAIDHVVMTAIAKDPKDRYASAQEMLSDLVSYKAKEKEEEAERISRIEAQTSSEKKILWDRWREKIMDALGAYRRVYDEYPTPKILESMVRLNFLLYQRADKVGDDETVERAGKRILELAPRGPEADIVKKPIQINFSVEGWRNDLHPLLTIKRFIPRAGFFEFDGVQQSWDQSPPKSIRLPRGSTYGLGFSMEGAAPLFIPLPVRPGRYTIRVPYYSQERIPQDFIVIPAGPAAARQGPGSYSEHFENWRVVNHDYAVGPLQTNEQYIEFLREVEKREGREAMLQKMPRNWVYDSTTNQFRYKNGNPINPKAPVTHMTKTDTLDYLNYLSQKSGMIFRLPTLFEFKRAIHGNDARDWPWGDATPDVGMAGFRFPHPSAAGDVLPLSRDIKEIRDITPFSDVTDESNTRLITHVVGNVQKFLHVEDPEERRRIAIAFGLPEEELDRYAIVAGDPYDSPAPSNPNILRYKQLDEVGPIGIMPVIELDPAEQTPSVESMSQ